MTRWSSLASALFPYTVCFYSLYAVPWYKSSSHAASLTRLTTPHYLYTASTQLLYIHRPHSLHHFPRVLRPPSSPPPPPPPPSCRLRLLTPPATATSRCRLHGHQSPLLLNPLACAMREPQRCPMSHYHHATSPTVRYDRCYPRRLDAVAYTTHLQTGSSHHHPVHRVSTPCSHRGRPWCGTTSP